MGNLVLKSKERPASAGEYHNDQDVINTFHRDNVNLLAVLIKNPIHNFRCMERLAGPSKKLIASIKGNAYGHGVVEVAQALETAGAYALMTGSLDEARDLRGVSNVCEAASPEWCRARCRR